MSSRDDIARDARDLRRGVAVNLLGYLIKVANPLLAFAVIFLYGSRDYGFFVAAQAVVMVVMRFGLAGFDKGVLWWSARQDSPSPLSGLGGAVLVVTVLSTLTAGLAASFAPVLADWGGEPGAAIGLAVMALGLVPMALTELFVSAAAGKRRMEATVFVRDGLGSVSMTGLGVVFYYAGMGVSGLPVAFVCSKILTCGGSLILLRRLGPLALGGRGVRLPRALVRYSLPYWLTEISGSFLQRMDVLALTAMSTPETVGIYGAVLQIANTLRRIRQAFDPIAVAIFSQIGARKDVERLRAGFSYATSLVIITQIPVYAFILLFADGLMGLLGDSYQSGAPAVVILSGLWILNGAIGLNGHIVTGYGRSDLALVNTVLTIGVQAALLWLLIPPYGLVGTAMAVGIAYTLHNVLFAAQAYWLTRIWPYDRSVLEVLWVAGAACGTGLVAWLLLPDASAARIATYALFLLVYGTGAMMLYRRGILKGNRRLPVTG